MPPRFDLPVTDVESDPYWSAATEGRLVLRSCLDCGRVHHYPRAVCPHCWSENLEWVDASGRARLYTYSTVYRNDLPPFDAQVPYVAAVVDLDEGPRMMTRVVDCPTDELEIGMALEVVFVAIHDDADGRGAPGDTDGGVPGVHLPMFRPRR